MQTNKFCKQVLKLKFKVLSGTKYQVRFLSTFIAGKIAKATSECHILKWILSKVGLHSHADGGKSENCRTTNVTK